MEIAVKGKNYKINISYGKYIYTIKKTGIDNPVEFTIDLLWNCIEKRFFFKPFFTKKRFLNAITYKELRQADKTLAEYIKIESADLGN